MSPFTWDGRLPRYPAPRAALYREAGLWSAAPVAEQLHEAALAYADREAVVDPGARVSYAELDRRTDQIAAALHALGLGAHDPVLFQVGNTAGTVLAWYGVLKAGAIPVATLTAHRGHEIGQISAQTGAVAHIVEAAMPRFDLVEFARQQAAGQPAMRHIFTVGAAADGPGPVRRIEDLGADIDPGAARAAVAAIQAGLEPEDVAVFQLSGGTTGTPKVIPRLHAEYWNSAACYARRLGRDEQSRTAHLGPLVHNAGVTCALHGVHAVGGCLVLPGTVEPAAALEFMAAERVSDAVFGHFMYPWVGTDAYRLAAAHLRIVVLSGAKVPPAVFDQVEELGARAVQLFGMGEGLIAVTPPDGPRRARLECVGTVIADHDEVRVLDPLGEAELAEGETGELACRGSYTIPGYFDAAEHNRRAFTADGFYRTGDLARIAAFDGERYLSIEGRIKDVINRGGEKVNAEELELLLLRHPAVAEAAVVAMPDPRLGERACACLVAAGTPAGLAEIRVHLDALGVAKYKWPERLEWLAALPLTPVGKIDKKRLRADIAAKITAETVAQASSSDGAGSITRRA